MDRALQAAWYDASGRHPLSLALLPLAAIYAALIWLRRMAWRRGWLPATHPGVPVVVVGNLTVGGTGKTPLVAWLVERLRAQGWQPGIVSRGYGGRARDWPQAVAPGSDAQQVGDEPVMLARMTGCPVAAAPERPRAAALLVDQGVNIIVADDGLQHYALARDIEIAVRDGARGYGNRRLLPAGPLREPVSRLATVDLELVRGRDGDCAGDFAVRADTLRRLDDDSQVALRTFAGRRVHAVAGIGQPQQFFDALVAAGLEVIGHPRPDHARYDRRDLEFDDDLPVLMTAKDAVKCAAFASANCWVVEARAEVTPAAVARIDRALDALVRA